MGDSARDMIERYAAAGVQIPPEYSSQPDHLALTLEYLAAAVKETSGFDQLRFINAHLDWTGDLLDEVEKIKSAGHYPALLRFLKSFIDEDTRRLNERDHRPVA